MVDQAMSETKVKRVFKLPGKLREATAAEKAAVKPQAEEQTDLLKSPAVAAEGAAPPAAPAAAAPAPPAAPPAPPKLKSFFQRKAAVPAAAPAAPPIAPVAEEAAAAAAAPVPPPAAPKEEAIVRKIGQKILFPSMYGDEIEPYAAGIFQEEDTNPYTATDSTTVYPIPTRRGFQDKILQTYDEFIQVDEGKPIDFEACRAMGAAGEQKVQIYLYQQFVREYMRQLTPYRGLLVYHGLGSGKTCSAIAAAQALFSTTRKKIIVMTPFSLRENFIKEITFCGFRHYRLQNFWVKLDGRDPTTKIFASQILGLDEKFLKTNLDIWVPDFNQAEPNFNTLTPGDRDQIRKQLAAQIQSRITFINYNGITATRLKEMACQPGEKGFFDDAVVVVDEVHNLTRLMQGTIEPYLVQLPGVRRRIAPEPVTPGRWKPSLCSSPRNYKRGYLLYRMLTSARNIKFIGLSGTPLINFPEELGILMNLLHGYTEICRFTVAPASEKTRLEIAAMLNENIYIDFVQTTLTTTGVDTMFTLLPEGTRKVLGADGKMEGVQKLPPNESGEIAFPTIQTVAEQVAATLQTKGYKLTSPPSFNSEPLLPPVGMQFRDTFIMEDGLSIKNELVLRKRLQGLISYYRGSKKELMPMIKRDVVVRVPMSKYQQAEYMRVRSEEVKRDLEKSKKSGPPTLQGYTGRVGALWAEIYDIAAMKNSNSYRMSSRQAMNFAFPEKITRPRAQNQAQVTEETGTDLAVLLDADVAVAEAAAGVREGEVLVGEAAGVAEEDNQRRAEEEDDAIDREEREEGDDEEKDELPVDGGDGAAEADETGAAAPAAPKPAGVVPGPPAGPPPARPRPAAPAAPPKPPGPPAGAPPGRLSIKQLEAQRAAFAEECKRGLVPGEKYALALKRAKQCLLNFARRKLMLDPPPLPGAAEGEAPDSLEKYSAKYAAILRSINAAPGSSLVYSQFLDMEGIGIFSICLDVNGFVPIEIQSDGAGGWAFSEKTRASLAKPAQKRYVVFTGAEKREVRSMALKLFNARFNELPETLQTFTYTKPDKSESEPLSLTTLFPNGNKTGEIARVFCITSAGAEGLSLRNVRQVHIMEPYWNSVRTDQVKGRAVRICSHVDLDYNEDPELNQRTVEVFTYCSVFPTEAQTAPLEAKLIDQTIIGADSITKAEAEQVDIPYPAGAKQYTLTSDEYLYMLSERKRKLLSSIQDLMKGAAVDCQLNEFENRDDGAKCLAMPAGSQGDFAYHPVLADDIAFTMQVFRERPAAPAAAPLAQALVPAAVAAGLVERPVAAAAAAAPPAVARPAKTIKVLRLKINGTVYQAVGRGEDPAKPFTYDLYGEFDKSRLKRLGFLMADITTGAPTTDITLF